MAFSHGSVAKLYLNPTAAATPTPAGADDVSQFLSEAGLEREIDSAETSALGTTAKTYVPGLTDASFSLSGMYDPDIDEILDAMHGNAAVYFEYHPQGTDTVNGKVKYTGTAILTSYSVSTSVDDMASIEAEFQVTGPVTRGVQS